MKRMIFPLAGLLFLGAWGVLVHRLVTGLPPSNTIQMTGPDGPEEYFTCQGPKVQIQARGDRVWMGCDVGASYWLTELDYGAGTGRFVHRLPGFVRAIHEDPAGRRLAIATTDALHMYDLEAQSFETVRKANAIRDVGWMNGRPWAAGGYANVRLYTGKTDETLMRLVRPENRTFDVLAIDRHAGQWRVIVFSRPETGDGPGEVLLTTDGATFETIATVPAFMRDGEPQHLTPKVLIGAAKQNFAWGRLITWQNGWQVLEPHQVPADVSWQADRQHTSDGTRWISYSDDSYRHAVMGRVHNRWAYFGQARGAAGWAPDQVRDVLRPGYAPMLRPLGEGYVLTNRLSRNFARLNANLERIDGRGWLGRIIYLYAPAGWETSGIERHAWRALVLPWVLLAFPVFALFAVRLRRKGFVWVWLVGAGLFAWPFWEMVQKI